MTVMVDVNEAKVNFLYWLARVMMGKEIIIARGSEPVARLAPIIKGEPARRVPGSAAGQVVIKPDFDAPLPENVLAAFEQ